ncbi:MAG: hypothetical protein KH230_22375 [Enterocloster asparagiformis]|nr:hypothetical protein [Enterocloster asparagiformis]
MKIIYEDTQIASLETVLNQIKVTGLQQARLLSMAWQIIQNGEQIEEPKQATPPKRQRKAKQLAAEPKPEKEVK